MKWISIILTLIIAGVIISGCAQIEKQNEKIDKTEPEINIQNTKVYDVEIKDFLFTPTEMRIKKGDSIRWVNKDSSKHTITSDSGNELNSKLLSQGENYLHTFNEVGIFAYHCTPHPYMKAKIIAE